MAEVAADDNDDDGRRDRDQRAVAAAAGALLGTAVGGPAGAVVGAALGPLLEPMVRGVWAELSESARQRQVDVLVSAVHAGIPVDELRERIDASERAQLLTGFALSAAARTAWEGKVRMLGRCLASGLLAGDSAKIDTEQVIIAAIAGIEGPQLAMLELLVAWRPGRNVAEPLVSGPLDLPGESRWRPFDDNWDVAWREWSRELIAHARPHLAPLAPSLLGTLQRHAWSSRTIGPGRRSRSTPRRSRRSSPSSMPGKDAPALSGLPASRGCVTRRAWHRSPHGHRPS